MASRSSSSGSVGEFGHVLGTVGGLVGGNTGTINYSQSSASVANDIRPGGGLVGYNVGTITQSLATGSVQGGGFPAASGGFVGGFVGLNDTGGVISESYATGSVAEDDGSVGYGAGLIGLNHGSVTQTYSIGAVSSVNNPGGLMGGNDGTVSSSYWDTQTSNQSISAGGTGLTTAQFTSGLPIGFDPTVWGSNAAINNGFPYLLWQTR
jgi:The GLUG motif